jgi:Sensors of blue-light using FAD
MLVRLMYASRATQTVDQEELIAILRQSKANNPGRGITGVLCCSGDAMPSSRCWKAGGRR